MTKVLGGAERENGPTTPATEKGRITLSVSATNSAVNTRNDEAANHILREEISFVWCAVGQGVGAMRNRRCVAAQRRFTMAEDPEKEELRLLLAAARLEVAAAHAARETAEKDAFFSRMLSISSSSAADSSSGSDVARRGAPEPVASDLVRVFEGLPAAPSCVSQWAAFCALHKDSWEQPRGAKLDENRDIHPSVRILLATACSPELRVWSNEIAADNVARAEIRPDFSVTHQRDAALSLLGALVQVEVKLPQKLEAGVRQLACYLRRRVYKLCCELGALGGRLATACNCGWQRAVHAVLAQRDAAV